jgi:serine/threonine protein kinase
MCSVYKGLHTCLEQEVAIKILLPEYFEDKNLRERFVTEAKIQARLSHPNVVKTLNFLENDHDVMLVMEYINGETLDVLLKKAGALPPERALAILESALEAIDFMHSKGIVHRDIKPANIMISYEGFVKVMDFGIAKVIGENGRTKAGVRIGTLWYMSPEQIKGEQATVLSDIYSLGITLYQMVTGNIPFDGDTEFEIMKSHIEKNPVAPWKINKDLSREIGNVILKAIAKNPKDRYQSVRELLSEIKAVIQPQDATRVITRAPQKRRLVWHYFQKLSRAGRLIIVAGAILVVCGIAAFSMHLTADKTHQSDLHKSGKFQSLPDAKPSDGLLAVPGAKSISTVPSESAGRPTAKSGQSTVNKSVASVPHAKSIRKVSREGNTASDGTRKKSISVDRKDSRVSGSGLKKSGVEREASSLIESEDGTEGKWKIRK